MVGVQTSGQREREREEGSDRAKQREINTQVLGDAFHIDCLLKRDGSSSSSSLAMTTTDLSRYVVESLVQEEDRHALSSPKRKVRR